MPEQRKREVACKVRVSDVLNAEFVKRDGFEPNFLAVGSLQAARVNLMGVVVGMPDGYGYKVMSLDDGSGRLEVRSFDTPAIFEGIQVGDIVMVIGRPREYGNSRHVVAEIVRNIGDKQWLEVRSLELGPAVEKQQQAPAQDEPVDMASSKVYASIKQLDSGSGADIEQVIKASGISGADEIIKSLLKEGDVFEISPGKLKVLE